MKNIKSIIAIVLTFNSSAIAEELVFDPNEYLRSVESTVPRTAESFQAGQRAASEIGAAQMQQQLYQQQMEIQAQEHAIKMERLRIENELLQRRLERESASVEPKKNNMSLNKIKRDTDSNSQNKYHLEQADTISIAETPADNISQKKIDIMNNGKSLAKTFRFCRPLDPQVFVDLDIDIDNKFQSTLARGEVIEINNPPKSLSVNIHQPSLIGNIGGTFIANMGASNFAYFIIYNVNPLISNPYRQVSGTIVAEIDLWRVVQVATQEFLSLCGSHKMSLISYR